MKNKRIRYVKSSKEGFLKSFRHLYSKKHDTTYSVELDTNEMTYRIINTSSRRSYEGGNNINNLHVLKRKAKRRLETLGVEFETETRDNSSRVAGKNCAFKKKAE